MDSTSSLLWRPMVSFYRLIPGFRTHHLCLFAEEASRRFACTDIWHHLAVVFYSVAIVLEITNTRERLEALSADMTISNEMCRDLIESYGFLQDLRLRHHAKAVLNKSQTNNLITAKELSHIDLLILKESLKIVSEFQKFLMKRYGVSRTVIYSQL